ncbi:hypothetical protein CF319_g402 [Tilletia indica]|uniref:Vps72/YL1 C-terminal domain-containing protein n=1 Tax=Tilletia indica TaxID=43049 RepID=A0A177TN51_9BASI|nr:hypothetical protein CF319_g402 [Tilletia indica]KAE8258501.1 hypothetical protein A4X13_0g1649 [Tilletia indica]
MSKRNKTLKQIVTTEREAALGLITSGKRKGKRPTAVEAAAVMAAGGVVAEPPFELTIKGPGGRKTRLVGAAARAAQARQLREQKTRDGTGTDGGAAEGGEEGVGGADAEMGDGEAQDAVMEDAQAKDAADESTAPSTSALVPPTPEGGEGGAEILPAPVLIPAFAPRRDITSYFSVDAPPSLRPRKRYCDVTGLLGPYTDPKSRLRYHNAEIYTAIRRFGPGVDQQYLALRGDAHTIK